MPGGVSLKWHGTQIAVSTGFDTPGTTITGITAANPPVVSAAGHGLQDGDVVQISGVVGMEEVNDRAFVVIDADSGTFKLADTDASGYGAYVSGGVAAGALFSNFCQLTGYNRAGGAAPEIDTTTICSTAAESELGLPDFGTTTLDFLFAPQDNVLQALQAADLTKENIAVKVVLPKNGGTMIQMGKVQSTSETGSNGTVWTGSATIRNSGPRVDILV